MTDSRSGQGVGPLNSFSALHGFRKVNREESMGSDELDGFAVCYFLQDKSEVFVK